VVGKVYSDWLLVDMLWSVEFIATGYRSRDVARSVYIDWLLVDGMGSLGFIATG